MAERKIREFLTGSGIKDDEITYSNGRVMVKGKDFMGATARADGSTYGDENQLNQAFNNYNFKDAMDAHKTLLNKPREQFSYNAQDDPLYQNALGAAQRSAATAGNNASVRLGSRGIGNSQQALTTENQIQQRAVADVNSNLLPQYMTQAYNQYKDRYTMDQDSLKNQLNLAGTYNDLNQQSFNNARLTRSDDEQTKKSNWGAYLDSVGLTGDLGTGPKSDWSLLGGRSGTLSMDGRKYESDLEQRGIDNTREDKRLDNDTRQTNASINNMNADNLRAAAAEAKANGDDEMALRFKIWENTGLAPEGIPGVPKGTQLASKSSKQTTYKDMPEFEANKAYIISNPNTALEEVEANKDQFIKDYGTDGYLELLKLAEG